MDRKLPYYMAYPMPLVYDDERRERMDFEYMKSMYPDAAKKLLPYIEDECDRMEYEGSMMFDEYPDMVAVEQLVREIIAAIQENEPDLLKENMLMEEGGTAPDQTWSRCVQVLIQVMVLAEMNHRRWRYFRMKRRNYLTV